MSVKNDIGVMFDGFYCKRNCDENLFTNVMELKIAASKSVKILCFKGF